jgi:hypothetical protein
MAWADIVIQAKAKLAHKLQIRDIQPSLTRVTL